MKYYNFKNNKEVDGQSIIHAINLLPGNELIGAEVGVGTAQNFCTILQNCPRISKLYGIDAYLPYIDYLKIEYDGKPAYEVDEKQIHLNKMLAMHNIEFSGFKEKVAFYIDDSCNVVHDIADSELDFIFLDTYLTIEQVASDIKEWYPKVKTGGLFSGHDWNSDAVQISLFEFMKNNNIQANLSIFDNTWAFIK